MKYTVIKYFTDLQDNNYAYKAGDTYPRKGLSPSGERIEELAVSQNKQKTPLIQAIPEAVETTAPAEEPIEEESPKEEEKPKRKRKRND